MSDFNTIAGWALAGGIVALGSSIVMGEVFHAERPETMGYVVEGVEEEGGDEEAEMSVAAAVYQVTVEQGESVFRRCASCHTVNQGGANGIGPNLYDIMGADIAAIPGYSYSAALEEIPGTWGWENMNEWLRRPSAFAQGTKMSFAGLSDPLDRAAVILYMNSLGSGMAMPPEPVEEETEAEDAEIEGEEAADPEAEAATEAEVGDAAEETTEE